MGEDEWRVTHGLELGRNGHVVGTCWLRSSAPGAAVRDLGPGVIRPSDIREEDKNLDF